MIFFEALVARMASASSCPWTGGRCDGNVATLGAVGEHLLRHGTKFAKEVLLCRQEQSPVGLFVFSWSLPIEEWIWEDVAYMLNGWIFKTRTAEPRGPASDSKGTEIG